MGQPRLYFAVSYRSGVMRPATVPGQQGKRTLVRKDDMAGHVPTQIKCWCEGPSCEKM